MTEPTRRELRVPREKGTYALLLQCARPRSVRVGALGTFVLEPGSYLYIGSARGSGGLRARLRHHVRRGGTRHWHLDYIRPHLGLVRVWYTSTPQSLEHRWARALSRLTDVASPFRGFGASDCRCVTHLFHSGDPDFAGAIEGTLASGVRGGRLRSADAIALRGLNRARAGKAGGARRQRITPRSEEL